MIKCHDFNTEWWGQEVGIVTDPAFFDLDEESRLVSLEKFAWVECVLPVSKLPNRQKLANSGFFYTDTQVRFRIDLTRVKPCECAQTLSLATASQAPFEVPADELRPFLHERFDVLPGASPAKVSQRYAMWASNLLRDHPQTCYRILSGDAVQGWFLSQPHSTGLKLTLAMLSAQATTSGFDLYARALVEYAAANFRLGFASFSVSNSPVHNIYANLGARFLEPRECWIWIRRA
ncbi:MAG: hypothetical protein ACM3JB_07065 [Acidobacteriaceae bacterium]